MTTSEIRFLRRLSFRRASSPLGAGTSDQSAPTTFAGSVSTWGRSRSARSSALLRETIPPRTTQSAALFSEHNKLGRPTPTFVSFVERLKKIDPDRGKLLPKVNRLDALHDAVVATRTALTYDPGGNREGLPPILLTRLPSGLVDVLILFAMRRDASRKSKAHTGDPAKTIFQAFVLHWLFFVGDDTKAAWWAFTRASEPNWTFNKQSVRELIRDFERYRIARIAPSTALLGALYQEVDEGNCELRAWEKRFSRADHNDEHNPGEALRVLSTNQELIKRALMWLQRSYIDAMFPDYHPMSDDDEDLPIDLDHIVPSATFNFDWRERDMRLGKDIICDNAACTNFRWLRGIVGESLGNYRWVAVSDNRHHHKSRYEPDDSEMVPCPASWNRLIEKPSWSKDDIGEFQRLIDRRTLDLYKKLITDSAITSVLPR